MCGNQSSLESSDGPVMVSSSSISVESHFITSTIPVSSPLLSYIPFLRCPLQSSFSSHVLGFLPFHAPFTSSSSSFVCYFLLFSVQFPSQHFSCSMFLLLLFSCLHYPHILLSLSVSLCVSSALLLSSPPLLSLDHSLLKFTSPTPAAALFQNPKRFP